MLNILKPHTATGTADHYADQAAEGADQAIRNTQRMAHDSIDQIAQGVESLRTGVPSALSRAAAQLEALSSRGADLARQTSAEVKEQLHVAGDRTVSYIQEEPVKSVLIAAAAGAALTLVFSLLSSTSRR